VDEADRPHRHDLRAVGAADDEPLRGQALSATPAALFRFVQVELAWPLGPPAGRHVLRTGDTTAGSPDRRIAHVVVLACIDAPRRGVTLRSRSRTRPAESELTPAHVTSGRARIISVRDPFPDAAAARVWLDAAGETELESGLDVLGRLLHAHRIATADPSLAPVSRDRLIAARIGFGAGEQVADGRWTAVRGLTEPTGAVRGPRRRRALGGSEARLTALLAGAERPLASEELTLRARLDIDHERPREGALQLLVALDAAIAELAAEQSLPGARRTGRGITRAARIDRCRPPGSAHRDPFPRRAGRRR
jgi:hypothetical protein